ncbi:unnamed protein product [Parnassius mnemosyne]|uniref:VWFC domain-containing protein n=1 Tax=Parnassius mnemosyne TaxID=213953 RepID=A0AAV1KFN6_9NEOP
MDRRRAAGALLALAACIACSTAAPMASNHTALDMYEGTMEGCYYNFQHYGEGDRIMTNEPCLNCTCHNRMLMCYLRVCPFTKAIGQDCTVEKRADQCCPIVTCPDVPVDLLTSTSTSSPAEYGGTGIGKQDKYGCSINGRYFPEGSKVPPTPNKPCEHCYCIRNMTTCVMQECTLHVDGCTPIYHKDVCCPVRYSCDHPEDEIPLLDDMTTTVRPTPGFLLTTTTLAPVTQASQDCVHYDQIYADGALLKTEKPCEHCYCMKGDIVCVVQECGTPMENEGKNCTSLPPRHGQCCPDTYICEVNELTPDYTTELTNNEIFETTSSTPPRRGGVEGSGYRIEPDEPYTDMPIFDIIETEGSGEDQSVIAIDGSETVTTGKQTPDLIDEMFLTTAKMPVAKPFTSTIEPDIEQTSISQLSPERKKPEISGAEHTTLYESNIVTESSKIDISVEDGQTTHSENKKVETTINILDDKVNNIATESSKPDISAEEGQTFDSENQKMESTIFIQDNKVNNIATESSKLYISTEVGQTTDSENKEMESTIIIQDDKVNNIATESSKSDISLEEGQTTDSENKEMESTITVQDDKVNNIATESSKPDISAKEGQTTDSGNKEMESTIIIKDDKVNNIATESSKPDISAEEGQTTDSENKEMETTIIIQDDKVNNIATESSKPDISAEEGQTTDSENKEMETTIIIQDDKVNNIATESSKPDISAEEGQTTDSENKEMESTIIIQDDKVNNIATESSKPDISAEEGQTTDSGNKEMESTFIIKDDKVNNIATESSKSDISAEEGQTTDSVNKEMESTIIIKDDKVNNIATESSKPDISAEEGQTTDSENKEMESTIIIQDDKATEDLSMTTKSTIDYISSSLFDNLTSKEDQYVITTEPTLRKEDDFDVITEVTTQKEFKEITTENQYYGQKGTIKDDLETITVTTASPENNYHKLETVGVHDIENSFQTEKTTTNIPFDASTKPGSDKDFKESTNEYISFSTIKSDFDETTSVNPIENEIKEDMSLVVPHGRIPGEGDCLLNGITYKNNTTVPSTNKCQTSCRCVSSIVKCDPIICSPPPEYENIMTNCQPVYDSAESCCPTYICDQSKETILPEVHSQMSGTDNPRPAITYACNGNECEETEDKQTPPPKQHEPCTSENCVNMVGEKQPDCGENGCENAEKAPILPIKHTEDCADGKCDQATAVTPCESGDCITQNENTAKEDLCQTQENCKDVQSVITDEKSCDGGICTPDISLENQVGSIEQECKNGNCRRKETSEVAPKLPSSFNTENILIESTTELLVSKDTTTKTKDISSMITPEFTTTKPDTKTDTVLEQGMDTYDTSSQIIDVAIQEVTTKYPESLPDITESELENFTSMKPKVEKIPESTTQNAISEEEHMTTESIHNLPEPALAEANAESDQKETNISNDENTTLNEQSKTPNIDSLLTTVSDLTETPKLPTTNTLEYTIFDHEKDLSLTETPNEITTPQNIDIDLQITKTYDTKPLVEQDEKDKEYYDKDITTTNILHFDSEYTTETPVSKTEDTEPKLVEKMSTKLPESYEYADKTTDSNLIYATKNIIDLVETTEQPIDNIDTQTKGKISSEVSNVLTTSIHGESTTEINEELELPVHVSTEQTLEYTMEEKTTTTTPEIKKYETKDHEATEMPDSHLVKEITTKKTIAEESFTELPVTTTKETEKDLMESLNGRGTELPVYADEKQSEISHSHETDQYGTTSGIGSGFEETQTEISKPLNKENTSQSTLEVNISTETPEHFETETVKIVTDSPTIILTEPVETDMGLSVVSPERDNNEGISTVNTFEKITTQVPESLEHHLFDKKVDEVKEIEPIHEVTIQPGQFSTEQVEEQTNIQTDSDSDTHKLATKRPHIIQTDEDKPTTHDKEYNAPEYETELSTSKTYTKVEDNAETYTENSIDITKQAEHQGSDEVYNTIKPTEISDKMSTTYKQDLPISATTMIPGTSSENILHTLVLKEKEEVTEYSPPLVTEDMTTKATPKETLNEFTTLVTPTHSEEKTTKSQLVEESITEVHEITTKGISKVEKTTITPHITDVTFSHDVINKVEEDIHSEVTTMHNAPVTDQSTPGYSEIVTQDDSKSPDLYDDTKATTDSSENLSSHMDTESEITSDHYITAINEQEEKTTKEPTSDKQTYTETPEITTENIILTSQDKDKTTVISDLSMPSKSELSESQVYKAPDAPSTQDHIKTTEIPNVNTFAEQHAITEESEQTRITTPSGSIHLEENIDKIEETTEKVITELPERATETEGIEKVTDILVATEKIEYVTEKTSASPAIDYIEKVTETTGQSYTGEIIAESPGKPTDYDGKDILYSTGAPQKEVTIPKEITTEVSNVHEKLAAMTPDEKTTEGMSINLPESETEGASGLSKLDKEMFTEIPPQRETEKPGTLSLETSTKQLPESPTIENEERSTPGGEVATVIVYTELPQLVTDNIRDSENINKDQKTAEIPENTATTPSKLPEDIEKETEVTNIHYQDKTTENPEKYTFDSTTLVSEYHDVRITTEKSFNVPAETSSYLETSTDDKNDGLDDKKYATLSTEIPETLVNKSVDMDKNKIPTETLVMDSTTKSSVSLPDTSITKITESAVEEDKNDLSENLIPVTSVELINITGKPDQGKTVTAVPDLHATQQSISDVSDDTTELLWTAKYETTSKPEVDKITSQKEIPDKVKVSSSSKDKISTDTTEEYTKSPEETFTEIHKDSLITDHDIFTTEKSKVTEETYSHENYAPIITTPESPKTHLAELETKLPAFLSTESQLSGSTEEMHISDDEIDITKAPEENQYTTESNAIDKHILHKQTTYQETIQTESPASVVVSSDESQDSHDETINLPKETYPDYITEKVDLSTKSNVGVSVEINTESNVLESKPIDETSKLPEYTKETSKPKYEYAESTPYFVELEEHTHKSIQETEVTPEVYHEEKTSTLSSEVQFTIKEQFEITTSKQTLLDQEKLTEDSIKETEVSTKEDQEKTTTASDLAGIDIFHSTSAEQSITTEKVTTTTKHTAIPYEKETSTYIPIEATTVYEKQETPKYDEHVTTTSEQEKEKESSKVTYKPHDFEAPSHETSPSIEEEFIPAVSKITTTKITEDVTTLSPIQFDNFTKRDEKPIEAVQSTPQPELPKPGFNEVLPTDDLLPTDEDNNFPPTGTSGYGQEPDYGEEDQAFGPGTCRYGGKVFVSAQQIPRDDPCDFCFCFRSDIICLQQSCPPPIHGCHEEPIQGFCCPRYECPVSMATTLNITTTTTTTTTTLPPHFLPHAYKGAAQRRGCQIKGHTYKVGEVVRASSGPCLHCTCGGDGQMKCDPKACTPEPMLRQMIAAAVSAKRRR